MKSLKHNKKIMLSFTILTVILILVLSIMLLSTTIYGAETVDYKIQNDWGNGAVVNVIINNTGSSEINGWTITWTFPGNQKISSMWNAEYAQTDASVIVKSENWNSKIPANGAINFGFQLVYSGNNDKPVDIKVNVQVNETAKITQTVVPTTAEITPTDIAINNDGPIGFASLNGGTTGGKGGDVVTATSYNQLKSYAESSKNLIIMVEGNISNGSNGGSINVKSNKSLIGKGNSAFLNGVSLSITNNNIIIQNLKISLTGINTPKNINDGDAVSITKTAKNVWMDHCELFSENPDIQTDIDKYDGLIDIRDKTGFITISWCYFHDHHKCGIVGASDSDLYADRKITFHHNYYKNVKLRIPMYRGSIGHFFNNYIVGAKDASEIREGACVRIEKNYYEKLHYSIYTPNDHPGKTQRIDNIEIEREARAYPKDCIVDIPYSYKEVLTENTKDVKVIVPQNAGVGKL